jgi:hypothetical protein
MHWHERAPSPTGAADRRRSISRRFACWAVQQSAVATASFGLSVVGSSRQSRFLPIGNRRQEVPAGSDRQPPDTAAASPPATGRSLRSGGSAYSGGRSTVTRATNYEFRTLPSGIRVPITVRADPHRPWDVRGSGTTFEVFRLRRGDSTAVQLYSAGRGFPGAQRSRRESIGEDP